MTPTGKIVKLKGGLGNQMFQYAFARLLQERYACEQVTLDFTYYGRDGVDNIRRAKLQRMNTCFKEADEHSLRRILLFRHTGDPRTLGYRLKVGAEAMLNPRYYFERNRQAVDVSGVLHHSYFDGYWQSFSYLEPVRRLLLNEFTCSSLSTQTQEVMKKLRSLNSVFVGVRRGDYISDKRAFARFGDTNLEYYYKAITLMREKVANPVFVFFSLDIDWVKGHLNAETLGIPQENIVYRDTADIVDDFEELYVMSSCRNAIIANSTFNFWAAWMIDYECKNVIAPQCWYANGRSTDILPPDWITL